MQTETRMQSFSRSFRFSEKPLFKDADVLECDHIPDQVLFRDNELEELAFLIRPGLRGQRPANILCRGLPATGKTTCIHHLFAEIHQIPGSGGTLIPIYVNCQRSRTAFAVFSTIYRELAGHSPPSSGIPLRRLMDAVAKALQSRGASRRQSPAQFERQAQTHSGIQSEKQFKRQYERQSPAQAQTHSERQYERQSERPVLLVCLDDIHHLIHEGTATQILSSLLRIHLDYPGCRVSVILVESDLALDLSRALDRSVTSSLCAQEVFFAPYTANQIRAILKERARQAAYPGVVAPGVLDLITDRTTAILPVDLRVGLDLLKRSILRAERAAHTTVTEEDVAAAYGDARVTYLRGLVSGLTGKERALLSVIAGMVEEAAAGEDENMGKDRKDGMDEMDDPKKRYPTSGKIYSRLHEIIEDNQLRRRNMNAAIAAGQAPPPNGKAASPPAPAAACAEPEPGYGTGKRGPAGYGSGRDDTKTEAPSSGSASGSVSGSRGSPASGPSSASGSSASGQSASGPSSTSGHSTSGSSSTLFPYTSCSYTSFYEHLRSLASYSLIGIKGVQGRGRTSAITLRYAACDVKRLCDAEMERLGEMEKR